jgi:hypothetical protein
MVPSIFAQNQARAAPAVANNSEVHKADANPPGRESEVFADSPVNPPVFVLRSAAARLNRALIDGDAHACRGDGVRNCTPGNDRDSKVGKLCHDSSLPVGKKNVRQFAAVSQLYPAFAVAPKRLANF